MTKEWLVSFIAEKARISTQRAELAYDAFWEAILSELKTGHFTLPYSTGSIQLKEKVAGTIKEALKEAKVKNVPAAKQSAAKKTASKSKPAPVAKTGRSAKKPSGLKSKSNAKTKAVKKKK